MKIKHLAMWEIIGIAHSEKAGRLTFSEKVVTDGGLDDALDMYRASYDIEFDVITDVKYLGSVISKACDGEAVP